MRVRKARPEDIPDTLALARRLDLDYPGQDSDPMWIAEDGGRMVGLVALKTHSDCLELCALGVDPASRGRGIAKALVEALMPEAPSADLKTPTPAWELRKMLCSPVSVQVVPSFSVFQTPPEAEAT